jgi:hypothetical protein
MGKDFPGTGDTKKVTQVSDIFILWQCPGNIPVLSFQERKRAHASLIQGHTISNKKERTATMRDENYDALYEVSGLNFKRQDLVYSESDLKKPCYSCGYCPYGVLVENFPLRRDSISCEIFGHDCPAFYLAEGI